MIEMSNGTVGVYRKLPNRKKKLITKEFCEDFKENLVKLSVENDKKRGYDVDYSNECYLGFFSSIESTYLFYNALEQTCVKHNVLKAIYEYAQRMPWYDADCFDDDLVLRMVELGVIPYTTDAWEKLEDWVPDEWIDCKIVTYHREKGYSVAVDDKWDKEDKESLEDIYKDYSNVEIVWSE